MIDATYGSLETFTLSYLDFEPVNGGFEGEGPVGESGGGSVQGYFNKDNYWNMTDSGSMVQSDGYVLADFNRDQLFDQVWYADQNGNWWTCTGGEWRKDDGPMDEWIALEEEEAG